MHMHPLEITMDSRLREANYVINDRFLCFSFCFKEHRYKKKWNNDFFFFPNFRHNFSIGLSWSACINRSFKTIFVHASIQLVQQTYFLSVK